MVRVRVFEERRAELYAMIRGFVHLYIGEEAATSGVMQALTPDDNVLATYREPSVKEQWRKESFARH